MENNDNKENVSPRSSVLDILSNLASKEIEKTQAGGNGQETTRTFPPPGTTVDKGEIDLILSLKHTKVRGSRLVQCLEFAIHFFPSWRNRTDINRKNKSQTPGSNSVPIL